MTLAEYEQQWAKAFADYRQRLGRIRAEKTRCVSQARKAFAKHRQLCEAETALLAERQHDLQYLAAQIELAEDTATWSETPKRSA